MTSDFNYDLVHRLPTSEEHAALFHLVGWDDHIGDEARRISLQNSLYGVVAVHDGKVVGMARVIGDSAHYFYIQDVVVHPDHSDHGLGSRITKCLLTRVHAAAGPSAFVGLFASPEAQDMYEELGFNTSDMTGMTGMHRTAGPTESTFEPAPDCTVEG